MSPSIETAAPIPATRAARRPRHGKAKAILAIAAGTALLLGGGGTYAYWTTTQALSTAPISSGSLGLTLGTGSWTLKGVLQTVASPVAANLTNVKIVPGDVLTLTQPLTVDLTGDTLVADLQAKVAAGFGTDALGSRLKVELIMPQNYGTSRGSNTYRLTPANAGQVDATVRITFDPETGNRDAVGLNVNLNQISFTLSQVSTN